MRKSRHTAMRRLSQSRRIMISLSVVSVTHSQRQAVWRYSMENSGTKPSLSFKSPAFLSRVMKSRVVWPRPPGTWLVLPGASPRHLGSTDPGRQCLASSRPHGAVTVAVAVTVCQGLRPSPPVTSSRRRGASARRHAKGEYASVRYVERQTTFT